MAQCTKKCSRVKIAKTAENCHISPIAFTLPIYKNGDASRLTACSIKPPHPSPNAHDSPTLVLAIRSPFRWSSDAEFSALLSCLCFIKLSCPALHICILFNNTEVVSIFEEVQFLNKVSFRRPTRPKLKSQRNKWLIAFTQELYSLDACIQVAWIKAHVGCLGNELADSFAKWFYFSCLPQPNLIPPPPKGCISRNGIPLTNKLRKKELSHVMPSQQHSALHANSSFDWY